MWTDIPHKGTPATTALMYSGELGPIGWECLKIS